MFHLRFTPHDISGYTFDWLEMFSSYTVCYEDKDKKGHPTEPHYHVLIETDYGEKSVRDAIKANFKIPPCGRGKNNKYYALYSDWGDKSYVFKYGDVRKTKGYSPAEIVELVNFGKEKYLVKLKEDELSGKVAPASTSTRKAKEPPVDRQVSIEILAWYYQHLQDNNNEHPTRIQMIEKACDLYRNKGKGINVFKIREIIHTLYFDVGSFRDSLLKKIEDMI